MLEFAGNLGIFWDSREAPTPLFRFFKASPTLVNFHSQSPTQKITSHPHPKKSKAKFLMFTPTPQKGYPKNLEYRFPYTMP
jgi:hypothetical protein